MTREEKAYEEKPENLDLVKTILANDWNNGVFEKVFPPSIYQKISAKAKSDKDNTLITLCHYNPEAAEILCHMIQTFSHKYQAVILIETSKCGLNALMWVVVDERKKTTLLNLLLDIILKLDMQHQVRIFSQADKRGFNALMFAAQFYPKAVVTLCEVIKTFKKQDQVRIFSKTDSRKANALIIAARFQPEAVIELCEVIKTFKKQDQVDILSQLGIGGVNALMLAAIYDPKAVAALCEVIKTFEKQDQVRIFSQVSVGGFNALMFAAQDHPESIVTLCEVIKTFEKQDQVRIFSQKCDKGYTATTIARKHNITAYLQLLELLPSNQAHTLFQMNEEGKEQNYGPTEEPSAPPPVRDGEEDQAEEKGGEYHPEQQGLYLFGRPLSRVRASPEPRHCLGPLVTSRVPRASKHLRHAPITIIESYSDRLPLAIKT